MDFKISEKEVKETLEDPDALLLDRVTVLDCLRSLLQEQKHINETFRKQLKNVRIVQAEIQEFFSTIEEQMQQQFHTTAKIWNHILRNTATSVDDHRREQGHENAYITPRKNGHAWNDKSDLLDELTLHEKSTTKNSEQPKVSASKKKKKSPVQLNRKELNADELKSAQCDRKSVITDVSTNLNPIELSEDNFVQSENEDDDLRKNQNGKSANGHRMNPHTPVDNVTNDSPNSDDLNRYNAIRSLQLHKKVRLFTDPIGPPPPYRPRAADRTSSPESQPKSGIDLLVDAAELLEKQEPASRENDSTQVREASKIRQEEDKFVNLLMLADEASKRI